MSFGELPLILRLPAIPLALGGERLEAQVTARVYAAAMALFRVPVVPAAVERKLQTVRETCQALYDEAHSSRAELLEIAVVLLIMLEVGPSLLRH